MSVLPEKNKDDLKRSNDDTMPIRDENVFNNSIDNISILSDASLLNQSLESSAKKIKLSKEEKEKLKIEKEQLKKEREMLKMQRELAKIEREKARIEKEKQRVAKEKQIMEEREKKQKDIEMKNRLKEEEKEKKEKLKREKEEQRLKIREAKEKEKLERIAHAEEESKAKEMKAKQEEEKLKKSRAVLFNFLKKSNNDNVNLDDSINQHKGSEDSFETTIVPESLLKSFDEEKFIKSISEQNETIENLYLNELLSGKRKAYDARPINNTSNNKNDIDSDCEIIEMNSNNNCRKGKYIFLKFYENVKPPYIGIRPPLNGIVINGRNPSFKIPSLEYDVDSDDEWDEGGLGESLSSSDSEPEEKDDYEIDNDFLVPHGYLSDDEFNEEQIAGSMNPDNDANIDGKKKNDRSLLKEQTLLAERSRRFNDKLIPEVIGCIWMRNKDHFSEKFEFLERFKAISVPK